MPNPETTDAIQSDVSEEAQLATLTSPTSPRMRAMALIEENNRARLEDETGVTFDSDDQVAEQLAEPAPMPAPAPEPEPAPRMIAVKVDGVEQQISQEDLVRNYQKNTAADRRLEEAARLLREAQQAPQPITPAPAVDDGALRDEVKSTLSVIYGGDEEAAAEALVNLLAKVKGGDQPTQTPTPAINEEQLADKVLERMAINTAFVTLQTDYPDLISDPNLEQLTAMNIQQLVAAGTPPDQAMLRAADSIYKSLGRTPVGRQTEPVTKARSSRQENKERLDPVPTAAAIAATSKSPSESGNPSAVIAELAGRRLGQSLPRQTG